MIHTGDAVKLVKNHAKKMRLEIKQKEYDGDPIM